VRELDAATIVGALADDHRRRAFAALELGATTIDEVVAATGLTVAQAGKAVGRLVEIGLVMGEGPALYALGAAFRRAAREALARPRSTEHDEQPAEVRKVMDAFVVDGRLRAIPTQHAKRLILLDWLAQLFEPGRRYSEQMVNLILGQRHADTAALRRYLVDEGFLGREAGEYWRTGGSTPA
jgi:hypothetical protein